MPDIDDLTPTQQLILDGLAARHRLGERVWPFSTRLRPALDALESAGLITLMHGNVERTVRASLTEAGQAAVLAPGYTPPNGGIERLRKALDDIATFVEERADITIGMTAIATLARRALRSEGLADG